jgi:succinate dehydrogenase / fumarate reductase, cytochrome b subunit
MNWFVSTLTSSIGRKVLMSLTGLFLILFLVVHLAGNLQLLFNDEGQTFNLYAHNMATNPLIKVVSIGNFAFILIHILVSVILSRQNSIARPVKYAVSTRDAGSTWASRNMGILGTILLIFLLVHLKGFWYEFKFGEIPTAVYEGETYKNVFAVVNNAYGNILYVVFYVVAMGFLAFHLSHGFQSAFQTLGLNHKKYSPGIKKVGIGFSILIPALFALIPVVMYLKG